MKPLLTYYEVIEPPQRNNNRNYYHYVIYNALRTCSIRAAHVDDHTCVFLIETSLYFLAIKNSEYDPQH